MCKKLVPQFDEGELPNNMRREQAINLGLLPSVTADGQEDHLSDTGTTVTSFQQASGQVARLLKDL